VREPRAILKVWVINRSPMGTTVYEVGSGPAIERKPLAKATLVAEQMDPPSCHPEERPPTTRRLSNVCRLSFSPQTLYKPDRWCLRINTLPQTLAALDY
jgi:hypothetical protein